MVTMNAGTSISQKRSMAALLMVALLLGAASSAAAQTGQVIGAPKFVAYDNNGDPCNGCKLFAYVAGTTTKQDTYTSSSLGTPNSNPVVLDSAGRWTIFLDGTKVYKFVLAPATDTDPPAAALWTVDNVTGQFAGVVTVTAADTRGVQISRSGAEAGLSIASTGGSGKTYGILSNTSGALRIQDDADATPRIELSGNNVNITASGVFALTGNQTVSGTLGVTGATTLGAATVGSTLAVTGVSTFSDNIITSQTIPRVTLIETDGAADNKRWAFAAETEALSLQAVNDAASVGGIVWSVERTGTTVDSFDLKATVTTNTGRYNSATLQPGFLAYNSTADNTVATGATVDFDTEVYDEASNFASDTFTAPVTGRYELCVTAAYSDNAADTYGLRIVTSARSYRVDYSGATTAGVSNGCVIADMSSGHAASVQVDTGDATGITIEGGASPLVTFFSGRLLP